MRSAAADLNGADRARALGATAVLHGALLLGLLALQVWRPATPALPAASSTPRATPDVRRAPLEVVTLADPVVTPTPLTSTPAPTPVTPTRPAVTRPTPTRTPAPRPPAPVRTTPRETPPTPTPAPTPAPTPPAPTATPSPAPVVSTPTATAPAAPASTPAPTAAAPSRAPAPAPFRRAGNAARNARGAAGAHLRRGHARTGRAGRGLRTGARPDA
ncbi:hypothetical protein [Deinococcus maricopensis]|uniref:hypothetical protein n=1 Tax=Deinococcus maricopensis TaxID=309887 RepID=UPI000305B5EB|nr:hypothetical protein [Deinococcus maricopensis]